MPNSCFDNYIFASVVIIVGVCAGVIWKKHHKGIACELQFTFIFINSTHHYFTVLSSTA